MQWPNAFVILIYANTGREMERYFTFLLGGVWVSVQAATGALIFATLLGLLLALMLLSRNGFLFYIARAWIELIRGTPALAQLFILYFGLADFGLRMPPLVAAIIGLGINGSAYLAEIFRSGIQAVDHGQTEAALSLGPDAVLDGARRGAAAGGAHHGSALRQLRRSASQGHLADLLDRRTGDHVPRAQPGDGNL